MLQRHNNENKFQTWFSGNKRLKKQALKIEQQKNTRTQAKDHALLHPGTNLSICFDFINHIKLSKM